MQKGIETWITPWKSIFSDIKPLVREDKADDRFAWVIILGEDIAFFKNTFKI
jgi:hypothetical protein